MNYHYVYCCRVDEVQELSNELLNTKTRPLFLTSDIAENLIEVDTPEDYEKWKRQKAERES